MEKINIISATDLHGFLVSNSYFTESKSYHGLLHFYEYIKEKINHSNTETIFIDNGDLFSGSYNSLFSHLQQSSGELNPVIQTMNDLECQFSVIGNHEFDFGIDYLKKLIAEAKFKFISANIVPKDDTIKIDPYYIYETKKGTRIAFIGLTTLETKTLVRNKYLKDFEVLDIDKILPSVFEELNNLSIDYIVLSYHGGYDEGLTFLNTDLTKLHSSLLERYPNINLFITGHTHCELKNHTINNTHTLQASCYGKKIALIRADFDKEHEIANISSEWISPTQEPYIPGYLREVLNASKKWLLEDIYETVESSTSECLVDIFVKPNQLIQLIHNVMKNATGADIVVAHFWRKFFWEKGEKLRRLDIIDMVPRNFLTVIEINKAKLKQALENSLECFSTNDEKKEISFTKRFYSYDIFSNISFDADLTKATGSRISSLCYDGKAISNNQTFKLALYDFRLAGAFGYSHYKSCPVLSETPQTLIDLTIEYMKKQKNKKIVNTQDWNIHYGDYNLLDIELVK